MPEIEYRRRKLLREGWYALTTKNDVRAQQCLELVKEPKYHKDCGLVAFKAAVEKYT